MSGAEWRRWSGGEKACIEDEPCERRKSIETKGEGICEKQNEEKLVCDGSGTDSRVMIVLVKRAKKRLEVWG